ncbi:MAG: hypothetical protein OEZ39_17200 [Gammaproteobacteria bacterium]|nr:hypothetical protein [Gammaproteobacteria bacterium]
MLNGNILSSTADARAAINSPTLSVTAAANGGFNARISTVPTNDGSFDETVLANGPWTVNVPKATVGAQFPALAACTGAGNTTFRAIGMPTDAEMFAANRRHEDHHAADHLAAFNASVVSWDTRMTAASAASTTYQGATEAEASAALHSAMGGNPHQVANDFFNRCIAAGRAYHGTPAGGTITSGNPQSNADCTTSSAEYTNPS